MILCLYSQAVIYWPAACCLPRSAHWHDSLCSYRQHHWRKVDLDKKPANSAINKDERISPKATLLRGAGREQQYRWGLSQKLSRPDRLLGPPQRTPSHRVSAAQRAEPAATGSMDRQGKRWARTGVRLGRHIRSGRRQGWAEAHSKHSPEQGRVPRAESKRGSWTMGRGMHRWGSQVRLLRAVRTYGCTHALTRTVPGVSWRLWLWKQ